MKYMIFFFFFTLTISSINSKSCGVNTIYTPNGINSPVIVYSARIQNSEYKFTVFNKQHLNTLQVENGEIIFTDKLTGEKWFIDKSKTNDKNSRNVLALCRSLHLDNTNTKLYLSSRVISRYSSEVIPKNVSFRKNKNSSFLQIVKKEKTIKESKDELNLDRLNQEVEQELEATMKPPQKDDQYESLNNEANLDRLELSNNNNQNQDNIIFG